MGVEGRRRRTPAAQSRTARSTAAGRTRLSIAAVVLVVAGMALFAFATSFRGVFVFDDRPAIVENASIRSPRLLDALSPPAHATVSGRPVANLTFALNYRLAPPDVRDVMRPDSAGSESRDRFLDNVWGYHAVNLAVHVLAALALFGVVRRSLESPVVSGALQGHAVSIAGIAALLWVVHPLTTGAVTYVVQRVESLMALFYLVTIYCAIRAGEGGGRRRLWTAAAIAACALGMATKEPMVTAPVVVWLWSVVFAGAPWLPWRDANRRWLHGGLAATWLVLAILLTMQSEAQFVLTSVTTSGRVQDWSASSYLWTQAGVILHYLRLAAWPSPLAFDYYGWPQARSFVDVWPQALGAAALVGLSAFGLARRHPLGFVGAACFIILAPTSSVVPISTEPAAEHRMYLPLAALVAGAVAAAAAPILRRRTLVPIAATLVIVLAIGAATVTRARNRVYWSDEALWADTVEARPGNARARINYGINLVASGRDRESEAQMRAALELPADAETRAQIHLQLGSALCASGRLTEGIPHIERALAIDPDLPEADAILGQALIDSGQVARGIRQLGRSLAKSPDNLVVLTRYTWLAATAEDVDERDRAAAVDAGERAVRLTGGRHVAALEAAAAAYARHGRFAEAVAHARRALELAIATGDHAAAGLRDQLATYERLAKGGGAAGGER